MPVHDARRRFSRNTSTPSLLKPIRLISASASGSRKSRGFGLPGWARGVTVPHSRKPNPSAASASTCAAFLSSPAASPTRFGNESPIAVTGDARNFRYERAGEPEMGRGVESREREIVRGLGIEREQQRAEQRVHRRGRGERPQRAFFPSRAMIPFAPPCSAFRCVASSVCP